jgi:type II secretory pathway predicted ATPase ExeA
MQYYGLAQPLSQAGYYETDHHKQLIKDIKGAILEGRLIAVCGVVGSGKTVTLRRLQQILKDENRVAVAKSSPAPFVHHLSPSTSRRPSCRHIVLGTAAPDCRRNLHFF